MSAEPINTLLEAAWRYAYAGLAVFPVSPADDYHGRGKKRPLVSQHRATTDIAQIEAWWRQWPEALIGHRIAPDLLLLDVDPRHNGKATWDALRSEMDTPATRAHMSGRGDGGGHTWWLRPEGKLSVARLDAWAKERGLGHEVKGRWTAGVDLLTHEHRYTILPPSRHPKTGEPYRWASGRGLDTEPAPLPPLLVDLLMAPEKAAEAVSGQENAVPGADGFREVDSPADWYSERTPWSELLPEYGWEAVAGDGNVDGSTWRHPEATTEHSATITNGCLFVYSTSTGFEPTTPGEPHGYTPFAAYAVLAHDGDQAAAAGAVRRMMRELEPEGQEAAQEAEGRRVGVTWAAGITLRRVRWCWDGRLALGTLGLLAGPEGLGKSTIAAWIGAQMTRGTLPGEHEGEPRPVLVAATEDSWSHTIAPRFLAAGADLTKVGRIEVKLSKTSGLTLPIEFPTDEAAFADLLNEVKPAMVIFDPLISRLNRKLDSHRDGEVRTALEPLVAMADAAGTTLLGLIHHNKSGGVDPLNLVMASKAFTAVARSVHTVIRDPDDETGARRYFGTPKNNLGTIDLPTKPFVVQAFSYPTEDGEGTTGQIQWGEDHDERIDVILRRAARMEAGSKKGGPRAGAAEWLEGFLSAAGGPVAAHKVVVAAKNEGHSKATLYRAKDLLVSAGRVSDAVYGQWRFLTTPQDSETENLRNSSSEGTESQNLNSQVSPRAGAHATRGESVSEEDL